MFIDIPEVQLIAVLFTGLFIGYLFLDRARLHPFSFVLASGLAFFIIRFIPAFYAIDQTRPGVITGNGIISAAIMWIVFFAAMLLGKHINKSIF